MVAVIKYDMTITVYSLSIRMLLWLFVWGAERSYSWSNFLLFYGVWLFIATLISVKKDQIDTVTILK